MSKFDKVVSGGKTYEGKSMKLGGGGRFAKMENALEENGYSKESAGAITASHGRKMYGKKKMASMSKAGMKRAKGTK